MKLDIKSFLIGILTTVNLFLLMGFDSNDENRAGRYLMEVGNYSVIWYDSHTGEIIGQVGNQELGKIFGSEKLSTYEGILNKINND